MKRLSPIAAVIGLFLLVGVASAHTGSISATQTCEAGYSVTGHLNADVAVSTTWNIIIAGNPVASGTGPGPANLGPYTGPVTTGSATLTITNGKEIHVYTAKLPDVGACATPTPTPTPTATPHPTPEPTPPSTGTIDPPARPLDGDTSWAFGVIALGLLIGFPLSLIRFGRRR